MTAKLVFHYSVEDPECQGDYHSVDIYVEGKCVKSYGDAYHDKGRDKANAFLEGYAKGQRMSFDEITEENVADSEL